MGEGGWVKRFFCLYANFIPPYSVNGGGDEKGGEMSK